jgi:uncharacterized phage infection (PIP) family protein YhgE
MKLIIQFLRQPVTIVGIITALLFQVFFSLIWLTGYDHVTDRVDQLPIAIINEDGSAAQTITDHISASLKFEQVSNLSLAEAQDQLEHRKIRMIIQLPEGFTASLGDLSAEAKIRYILNESNPQMVTNVMQNVAAKVTAALNMQSTEAGMAGALAAMKLPEAQAELIKSSAASRISSEVQIVNPVDNFAETMVPLMIVTASFTGGMLLAMNLSKASASLSSAAGKWQRLSACYILMACTALGGSLISASLIHVLGIHSSQGFLSMWMFEFVVILSCMAVANLSLMLLGDAGAWLNVALLSIQMLSSGATIPRDVLSPFYQSVGQFFPAYYAVDGMLDLVIGGEGIMRDVLALIVIAAAATLVSLLLTQIRREKSPVQSKAPVNA